MIKRSMRNKLIAAIFIGCLIPYFLGGLYLKSFIEKGLYKNSLETSNQTLSQVGDMINKTLIDDMREEVNMLASLDCVKNAGEGINSYTEFNADTDSYIEYDTEQQIEDYFRIIKESHSTVNFIFFGTEEGGYMEYPRFSPAKSYDPRQRPWYTNTIGKDGVVMSEPYITNVTGEMVVSFTKQVKSSDKTVGVIGISVNLNELTTSISRIKLRNTGYLLVLSREHKFIISPNHQEWILKTPVEIGQKGLEKLEGDSDTTFVAKLNGTDYIFNLLTIKETGLHIVTVISKDEILLKAREITRILTVIYIITILVVFMVIYPISKRMTRPILEISSVIRRMTEFDFDDKANLKHYTKRSDEIGTVSSALVEMHDSYFELIGQLDKIDEEIKNIDIESNNRFRIELSERSPFFNVMNSINVLLDRIYSYFDQLKASNSEIAAKNKLLVASEEELTAQLEEIEGQKEYINFLAYHDSLTELPNRRNFIEVLTDRIQSGRKGAVVLLDLDDFKEINDIRGHVFGDRVLEAIAKRFIDICDDNVFLSRFGGDEFLFLIDYQEDKSELDQYVRKISELFNERIKIDDNDIEISYSMGIALFPDDSTDVNQLIMAADLAMYSVKNSGKNGYQFFHEGMMDHQIRISNIVGILREAIKNDGFRMVYQPQIEVKSGQISGYEALLRLKASDIPPSDFIKVAEKNGLIIDIGRIVTEKVIAQLKEWTQLGLDMKPVSINFSACQLHDSSYVPFIREMLDKYAVDARLLQIEITENIFLENRQITINFLKQLYKMGIKIAIDDFGSGYSSLNYLAYLPVDIIKLDRSLNMRFLAMNNVKVMDSLISLVHSLGLTVIAEGIETVDHVKILKRAECDHIQGYYFSRPLEAEQIPPVHSTIFRNY